jgi:hypothetical protein
VVDCQEIKNDFNLDAVILSQHEKPSKIINHHGMSKSLAVMIYLC